MQRLVGFAFSSLLFLVVACGPNARSDDDVGDDDDGGPDAAWCTPTSATETACDDGFDDDCNGFIDCGDVACAEQELCAPVDCEVTTPSVMFPLPDGDCTGVPPSPGAPDSEMEAFLATCGAYEGVMNLSGFAAGARLTDPNQLIMICATMEHTWLRDMQMEATCPDGNRVVLSKFQGQTGGEVFLGEPITEPCDWDSNCTIQPGVGYEYCWTMAAANPPLIDHANATGLHDMPAGDYRPSQPFAGFANCTLNGAWTIRIIDGWGVDNGVVFATRMVFDASLSDDCPIIE